MARKTKIVRQSNFFGGQVDKSQFTRTSFSDYLTSAQELKNCVVDTTGLIKKRVGSHVVNYLDQKQERIIGNKIAGVSYIFLLRDFALTIYKNYNEFVARLDTPYGNVWDIDYTFISEELFLVDGGTPIHRVYLKDNEFILEPFKTLPIPSRDFGDIVYTEASVTVSDTTISVCAEGFNTDWVGGTILGYGVSLTSPIGEGIIDDVTYSGECAVFKLDIISDFPSDISKGLHLSIRKPMMSANVGWPSKICYFQRRLWLGNFKLSPDFIAGSNLNDPARFNAGGRPIDGIIVQIPQVDKRETIRWIHGGKQLEVYTNEAVYTTAQTDGITPSTFSLFQQSRFGTSLNLKPITYQNDSYYASEEGNSINKFTYQALTGTSNTVNVTKASQSLIQDPFDRTLITGASAIQDNFLYFINKNKQIYSFQFSNEIGLAAITPFESAGDVLSITELDNKLIALKHLTVSNTYVLEEFTYNVNNNPLPFLDSIYTTILNENNIITGLDYYEGYPVHAVMYDNLGNFQDLGSYAVNSDTIVINNPNKFTGVVHVGFIYDVRIVPMYFFIGSNNSSIYKKVTKVIVEYYDSLNFKINGELVNYQTFSDIQNLIGLNAKTGVSIKSFLNGFNRYCTFLIEQKSPFNLCITSIAYQITGAYI